MPDPLTPPPEPVKPAVYARAMRTRYILKLEGVTTREMTDCAVALLSERSFDATIPYAEWTSVLGANPEHDPRARRAVLRSGRKVLREQHKKLVNIRRVGYRIIRPNEHAAQSKSENRRARRRLREALATVTYVALENLTPAETAQVLMEQARNAIQVGVCQRLSRAKALPSRDQVKLPATTALVDLMRRARS